MLKKRLIATLLCRNGRVVQSINFKHTNVIGNAITAVDFFNTWAVDEIAILDVSRTVESRNEFYKIIEELSERCFVPLTAGGWVTKPEDVRNLLKLGADKVVINTHAYRNPDFIKEVSKIFGSQCIIISIDTKMNSDGNYEVFVDRGREPTGMQPLEWSVEVESQGAGEIYLTSIDQDGSRIGYDLELTKIISQSVEIPVIASGGVGNWQHLVDGVVIGKADAVSAANIFHFTEHSTKKAKEYMQEKRVDVRETVFYKNLQPRKPRYEIHYRV